MEKATQLCIGHRYVLDRYAENSIGEFTIQMEQWWDVFLKEIFKDGYVKISTFLKDKNGKDVYGEMVVKAKNLYKYQQPTAPKEEYDEDL